MDIRDFLIDQTIDKLRSNHLFSGIMIRRTRQISQRDCAVFILEGNMYADPKAMAILKASIDFQGRDRRRIKREVRKAIKRARRGR